ncbi:MAG: hypothetical protein NC483_00170 [Ruminococcus sp.]|nr:hypothetical protein [Ruminococcus sp.]
MNNSKNQSLKKALIFLLSIIVIGFLALYIYKWIDVKEQSKYIKSYLIDTNTINLEMTDINEISSVLSETASDYYIYISYTKDKNIYEFEKKLKPLIDKYNLQNNFYYLNITDIKENDTKYKEKITKELGIETKTLNKLPVILYYQNGKIIRSNIHTINDFKELLESQEH